MSAPPRAREAWAEEQEATSRRPVPGTVPGPSRQKRGTSRRQTTDGVRGTERLGTARGLLPRRRPPPCAPGVQGHSPAPGRPQDPVFAGSSGRWHRAHDAVCQGVRVQTGAPHRVVFGALRGVAGLHPLAPPCPGVPVSSRRACGQRVPGPALPSQLLSGARTGSSHPGRFYPRNRL